eukprot:scaffold584_cov132-Cylindrotheca_fusiformis.AAC.25
MPSCLHTNVFLDHAGASELGEESDDSGFRMTAGKHVVVRSLKREPGAYNSNVRPDRKELARKARSMMTNTNAATPIPTARSIIQPYPFCCGCMTSLKLSRFQLPFNDAVLQPPMTI